MQVTFLIGGTGNQLFQFATAPAEAEMSTFFLRRQVRGFFGWTQHEQIIKYEEPSTIKLMISLTILVFDLILAKMAKISLFTELDTRMLKLPAKIKPLVRLGYFQRSKIIRNLKPLSQQIAPNPEYGTIALHVRGGDILALERMGRNEYGMLKSAYYCEAIAKARDFMISQGRPPAKLLILTDDPNYAATLNINVKGVPQGEILSISLNDTFACATSAECFISSNSTMSYWIVKLREDKWSVAPYPFQKRREYDLYGEVKRINVSY